MIQYDKFTSSLKHLELQYNNYQQLPDDLEKIMKEAVAESVIQRFETCYDCMWKVLKRYLTEELGLPEVPNSPKPILRIANENNILPSDITLWLSYADARIGTSHDYSGTKALDALNLMNSFVPDAIKLYETMSKEKWV